VAFYQGLGRNLTYLVLEWKRINRHFDFAREAYLVADRVEDSPQLAVGASGLCSRIRVGQNKERGLR
jgi:hypothetical protein